MVVGNGDSTLWALLLAYLAADTAVLADILRDLSDVLGGTPHVDLLLCGVDNDKVIWTRRHALSTSNTLCGIDNSNAVDYRDSVFGANRDTVTVAVATGAAVALAVIEALGSRTGRRSDKAVTFLCRALAAVAAHKRNLLFAH